MRRLLRTKPRLAGFTLIEVMVIAPILILTLGGFVYTLSTIIADSLVIRDTNGVIYDTQGALDRIEQDARLSVQFLSTSGALPSPQGSDGTPAYTGTAAFTSTQSNTLIFSTISTDSNPLSPTRQAIYFANPPCNVSQIYNTRLLTTVIYYVNGGSLYRRTYVPSWTTTTGQSNTVCAAPWQENSCSPGYNPSITQCQTNDALIMNNVQSLTPTYYTTPDGSTSTSVPENASTIKVSIQAGKTTAGQPVSFTGAIQATKLNTGN